MATKINTMNLRGGPPGRDNGGPHGYHESVSTKLREGCGDRWCSRVHSGGPMGCQVAQTTH